MAEGGVSRCALEEEEHKATTKYSLDQTAVETSHTAEPHSGTYSSEDINVSINLPCGDPCSLPVVSCSELGVNNDGECSSTSGKIRTGPIRPSERVSPYKKREDLPPFHKLSFSNEVCVKQGCQCTRTSHQHSEAQMNYARVCKNQEKYSPNVIKEAKLRLHNQQKDQREVIRAARLKIHKHNQAKSTKVKLQGPLTVCDHKSEIFSGVKYKQLPTFGSLAAKASVPKPSETSRSKTDDVRFAGESFKMPSRTTTSSNHAVSADSSRCASDSLDLGQLGSTLPEVAPPARGSSMGRACTFHQQCTGPCTCSCAQQALMTPDDLTVEELACYLEDFVYIPRKMSSMAEMMYT